MKKLIIFPFALAMLACTGPSQPESNSSNAEANEEQFDKAFKSVEGEEITEVPKYAKTTEQAASDSVAPLYALTIVEPPPTCVLPTHIRDLKSSTSFKIYKFDQDAAASASAMGFSGTISRKQMVLVQDYARYQEVDCSGKKKKFGVGLRCIIHVKSLKGSASYSSLPSVAASVQLGQSEATFEIVSLGFGLNGDILADGLPTQGDYNVDNFGKLSVMFNRVLKTLVDTNSMDISVVELP